MNVVICMHPNNNSKYMFKVPDNVRLHAGDYVLVQTSRSPSEIALCVADSFEPKYPELIAKHWDTEVKKLKPVIAQLYAKRFEYDEKPDIEVKETDNDWK